MAEEVRREIDNKKSYNQTTQSCIKQIYSKLSDPDRKMQGQTLDAYNAYAMEEVRGDLNLLYSCGFNLKMYSMSFSTRSINYCLAKCPKMSLIL